MDGGSGTPDRAAAGRNSACLFGSKMSVGKGTCTGIPAVSGVGTRFCPGGDVLFPENVVILSVCVYITDNCRISVAEYAPREGSDLDIGSVVRRYGGFCRIYGYNRFYSGNTTLWPAGAETGAAGDAALGGTVFFIHAGDGRNVLPVGVPGQLPERIQF